MSSSEHGAPREEEADVSEDEALAALLHLDPLWDELFPAEQARIVQLLIERVDVRMHGVEVRLRPNGLSGLVREVAGSIVKRATLSADGETITVHIPESLRYNTLPG